MSPSIEGNPLTPSDEHNEAEIQAAVERGRQGEQAQRMRENQEIEARFGKPILEQMREATSLIGDSLRTRVLAIGKGEGSTDQKSEMTREYLGMWRDFGSAINTATMMSHEKKSSSEQVEIAVEGATALLRRKEANPEHRQSAQRMVDALKGIPGITC
jgi:hypothetical protein